MNEDQLEQLCLDWFREGGWEYSHGPDIAPDGASPERADYNQVLLLDDLRSAISRINPHLPETAIDQFQMFPDQSDGIPSKIPNIGLLNQY